MSGPVDALISDENCENDEMKRGAFAAARAIHVVGDSRDSPRS